MKLFEFQGKELFAAAGIPLPASRLVRIIEPEGLAVPGGSSGAADRVREAAKALTGETGASRLVVKAQLDMGGRGKAGLIKVVSGADPTALTEAVADAAAEILAKGYTIPALLIEEAAPIERELYLSISAEPETARYVILASAEGGVEIEELAKERPEAIKRVYIDPFRGLQSYQSRGLAYDLGLEGATGKAFARLVGQLYRVFKDNDAELAEINPVFVTGSDGSGGNGGTGPGAAGAIAVPPLIAGDAKVIIDDNSLDRQPTFKMTREQYDSDAAYESALEGIPYVQFDGDISLMCAGAGLTTTVFDLVNYEGGHVANYLEFGGPNYHKAQRAMELCLKNESSVILIVTFGTIARADVMAEGVVTAIRNLNPDRPIVTCIRGTNEEEADKTLRAAGLTPLYDTEEAVRRAVALAAEAAGGGAGGTAGAAAPTGGVS
ncbi:MAG: succinate--CoA ligase [Spirochaeta sp.]|jgi:succinyl-CoA synthetase beta subunit|nr:succinate--CoA ligase [Spirochaeta sp.]